MSYVYNPRSFGASETNTPAQNTIAFQQALTLAEQHSGTLEIPHRDGAWLLDAPLIATGRVNGVANLVTIRGENSKAACVLRNDTTDIFQVAEMHDWRLLDFGIEARGGHGFNVALANRVQMDGLHLWSVVSDKSAWAGQGFTACHVRHCTLQGTDTHTVPLWHVVSTNDCNQNVFEQLWSSGSAFYVISLEGTASDAHIYGNVIRDCVFHNARGGAIRLQAHSGGRIENVRIYDTSVYGSDLIKLQANTSGKWCRNVRIVDYERTAGTLPAGVYDVNLSDTRMAVVSECMGPNGAAKIKSSLGGGRFSGLWPQTTVNDGPVLAHEQVYASGVSVTPMAVIAQNSPTEALLRVLTQNGTDYAVVEPDGDLKVKNGQGVIVEGVSGAVQIIPVNAP